MSIQSTNIDFIIGAPGQVEPGDYEYVLIGASYWAWPHATFVPGTSTIDYVIGADNYVVGGPLPGLFVAVGSDTPVSLPGEFSRGNLQIEGSEGDPVVVDVRAFEGWEELSDLGAGAAAALFMVAVAGADQGEVDLTHARVTVDGGHLVDGSAVTGRGHAIVMLGEQGYSHASLELREDSYLGIVSAYESTLMVGHGDTQTYARLLVQESEVFLESNDPQIEVSGREGTHIQVNRGSLQIVSEPDAAAMADGEWVSASLILGGEGGYGRLQADGSIRQDEYGTELLRADGSRWGNDILVQGAHASVELGIGGGDSYGLAYIDWGTQLVVDASADAAVYDSGLPDVPDSPFAFINIGGKPWADGSPGDEHGGEGALVIRGGEVFLKTDASQLDGSSVVNVGSAGGTGLLKIESGSLAAERITVGSGVDYGPVSPAGYGVLDVRYNGEIYADSITVGDLTGLATGQHAFFLSDSNSGDLSVGLVDITTGGVLLGHSFTLDTALTIGVGGALMVGDDYVYDDTSWSSPSARGHVVEDAGYFRNEGHTTIQGDVIMQFEGREADFSDSDVIKNADGASIDIGSTARFNLSLSADNSYFVAGGFAADDPALVGSQTWGRARVIQQEGTSGNVSIDDGAQVLINGVDGDLWQDDSGDVWAYFDLGQVFPERDYWVVEGSNGLPISVALEKPDVYDHIATIYDEPYASYNQVVISSEFSDTWGTAGDDVIRPGENGDRTVTIHSGGGNDFIYADNAYANLGLQDRDELDLSDITDDLVWDTQYGSVTNGTWTTLFVGLESLVGGKGNDSYNLSGLKALSIADFEGNNQYVLSESVTNIGQMNWEIAYDKEGMQAPETPLYIKAVAASDGSLDVQRLAISGDTLLGTDQVSGVALFVGSDGDDTWNFDGYIANAYTGTYGVPWQILSVASGDDVVVGNGFTRVEFGRTDTDFSGLTFNAASATLNEDGLFVYSVATDTGTKQLVNVDAIGGTSGDDTFLGSSRDELFVDYGGNDQISGGFGVDVADYRNVDHYINVYLRDEVDGSQSSVNGYGSSAGSDNLSGVEMVRGTAGNDYFSAYNFRTVDEFGNESTFNAFRGRGGDDRVYGNGNTRVEYVDSLVAVHVDLQSNYSDARYASDLGTDAYVSSLGKDEIYNVNAVSGSAYDDWLVGSSAEMEFFEGRAGDDLIDGGGGVWNQVRYDFDTGGVTVNLGTGVAFDGWGGADTLIDIDGVTGSAFDDLLIGSDSDYQQGFQGGAGNDTILAEGGYDEVMFINAKAGVNVDLSSVQTTKTVAGVDYSGITIADGSGGTDFVSGVEGIEGSGFNDTLTGSDGNNRIDGRGGSDTLDGGDGVDWVEYNNDAGGVFVSLADGVAIQGMDSASYFSTYTNTNGVYDAAVSIGGRDKDTLSGFENIQGSQGNDVLIGDGGDNRFVTVGGTDYVVGGAGIDTLIVNGTYDSSWLQADAFVEGRFIHYEDGNRKTVIEGIERIEYADGQVRDVDAGGSYIDLGGADTKLSYVDQSEGPFIYWNSDNGPRLADPPSVMTYRFWDAQPFALDGGVQAVRLALESRGDLGGLGFNLGYQSGHEEVSPGEWRPVLQFSMDLLSDTAQSQSFARELSSIDPATGNTSYSDVDFKITLTPVTVGGKLGQEIIVETLDGTPISSAGFAELMSSIVVDYGDKTAAAAAQHNVAFDMVLSTRGEAGATWFEAADGDTNRSILSFENEPLTAAYAAFNGEYLEVSFKQISDGDPRDITGSDDEWNGWMGDPSSDLFTVTVNGTDYAGANGEVEVLMSDGSLLLMLPGVEMAPGANVSITYVAPEGDQIYEVLQRWNGQDVSSFTIAAEHSNSPVTRTMLADAQAGWSNIDNFLSDDADIALPGIGLGGVSAPITAISGGDVTVEIIGSVLAGNPVFDASATDGYAQYEWAAEALQVTLSGLDLSARGVGDEVSLLELFSDGVRFSSVLEGAYGANGPNDDSGEVFYFIQNDVSGVGLSTYQFVSSELGVTWGGVTFNGSDYADVSMGGLGDDVLRGNGGDDYFIVGAGDDYVDGGEGVDTVQLTGRPLDFSVDLQANGEVLITYIGAEFHPFHVDTLTLKDVEYLRFEVEGQSDSYYRSMPVLHHGVRVVDGEVVSAAGDYSKAYNPEAWQTLTQGLADELGYSIVEGTNARNEITAPSGQSALFGYAGDDRFFIETSAGSKTLAYGDGGWDELRLERLDGSATITIDDRRVQLSDGQEVLYAGIDRIRGTHGSDTVTLSDSDGLRDDTGEVIMLGSHLNYQSMGGSDTVTLSFGSSGDNASPANTFMVEYDWVESGGIDLSFTAANTASVSYVGGMDTLVNVQSFRDSNQADTLDFSGQDRAYWSYVKVTGGDDIVIGGDTSVSYDGHSRNDLSENSLGITVDFSKAVVDSSGRTTLMVDARELVSWDGVSFGVDTLIDVTRIYGSYAADTFIGDYQNNSFRGEEGDDYLNGGGGWDTASYRNADHAIQVDMAAGVVSAKDYDGDSLYSDGTDTLREMEAVQGTTYADYYDASAFGAAGAFNIGSEGVYNRFEGRGGDDVIVGNGYTQVAYWGAAMGVSVDLNTGIADVADVEDKGLSLYQETLGRDTFSGVSAVSGSNYDDIFIGTDVSTADHGYRFWEAGLVERFEGRGGSDTINGGSGGLNVADYRWESGAVSIDLSAGQVKQYEGEIADSVLLATDTLINIHEVRGTNFGDRWIGSDNGGSDIWFRGVDNVQSFSGGAGDDWIDGRGGINEAAYWFDPAAVTVDLRATAPRISAEGLDWIMVTDGFGDTDYLRNIQWLEGTNFNDTFYGDDADNFIDGRRGDDFIDGGSGSDTAEYNQTSGGVFVNLSAGKAFEGYQLTASSGDVYAATASGEFEDTLVSIENVVGSLADDYLIGDAQNNSFDGLLGHDVVAGGGGIDTLILRGNQDEFVVAHLGADAYRIESLDGSVVVTAHDIEMLAFADKDVALNRVFVSGDSVLLPEGDSGVTDYTFGIELGQPAFGAQSVDWAVELIDGEASLADFSGDLSGTVTFAEGETSKQITLGVVGDIEKEGREDFRIKVTPQSEDILVDIDAGVLDVQIKDDDGYDLGGQVYFWGKGDPAKQYLMDGVDVGLTVATDNVPEELYASAVNLKNLKLNAETGQSTAEVWTDFENMSAVEFSVAAPEGSTFVSALGSGWTVVETLDSGVYGLNAVWNGADNSQTADRLKLGTFTFDTPALGADVQLNVLSAAVGNDAGESKTNASPIRMSIGYESQTVVSSADSAADGSYSLSSLAEGGYQVMLDKDFELYTISEQTGGKIWSSEAKAVNVFDARATLLIASGKEASSETLIAADVDGSGSVNVFDARAILLMSSRNETALDRSLEWVFVAEDADLSGVERRTVKEGVDWEQGSSILLDDDAAHQNLVAILRGDVDGSYRPEDDLILFV